MLQSKYLRSENTVKKETFEIKVAKYLCLHAQHWKVEHNSQALIILAHGFGEHSSFYNKWISELTKESYSVLAFDMRGHGKSPGKPGGVSYNILLSDLQSVINEGKKLYPNTPIFLYGHCLGANLIANLVISKVTDIEGIIMISPWLELTKSPPKLKILTINIIKRIIPSLKINSHIKIEDLSRELRVVHQIRTDQLAHNKISLGLFSDAYEKGLLAKRSLYKINIPLLIIHGDADKITSSKASKEFVMNASKKTTYIEIKDGSHALHHDSENHIVFNSIITWLKKHTQQKK